MTRRLVSENPALSTHRTNQSDNSRQLRLAALPNEKHGLHGTKSGQRSDRPADGAEQITGEQYEHASHFAYKAPSGDVIRAYPVGKEREALNEKFEELIQQVKEMGLFHEEVIEQQMEQPETKKELTRDEMIDRSLSDAFSYANCEPVQLSFGDFER